MLTFKYKKGLIKITEVAGKENNRNELKKYRSDVVLRLGLKLNTPEVPVKWFGKYSFEINIPNFIIDLRNSTELLYKKIHKGTRADIKKAMDKDMLSYFECDQPTDEQILEFSLFFNSFAKEKRISFCNTEKLKSMRDNNSLIMTYIEEEKGEKLCASMLQIDRENKQIYGLYGVSSRLSKSKLKDKNYVGRANKLLQWKEILTAKARGMDWYNFGGEVNQVEDQGVNDFKRRYGTINAYDCRVFMANSFIGILSVLLLYFKWKKYFQTYQSREEVKRSKSFV